MEDHDEEEVVFVRQVVDLTREVIDLVEPNHEVVDLDAGDNEEDEEDEEDQDDTM